MSQESLKKGRRKAESISQRRRASCKRNPSSPAVGVLRPAGEGGDIFCTIYRCPMAAITTGPCGASAQGCCHCCKPRYRGQRHAPQLALAPGVCTGKRETGQHGSPEKHGSPPLRTGLVSTTVPSKPELWGHRNVLGEEETRKRPGEKRP